MGTNYYLQSKDKSEPARHLGKSSGGWVFSLHVYPEEGINTWEDVFAVCRWTIGDGGYIKNEYGDEVPFSDFVDIVTNRSRSKWIDEEGIVLSSWYKSVEDFLKKNHAERGPNNLLRHKIDGTHCIGHGNGTYAYIVGDFS